MEMTEQQEGIREEYLGGYDRLIGDKRTRRTFREVIEGITGGESLCAVGFTPKSGQVVKENSGDWLRTHWVKHNPRLSAA